MIVIALGILLFFGVFWFFFKRGLQRYFNNNGVPSGPPDTEKSAALDCSQDANHTAGLDVLIKMGCYLASNDGQDAPICSATPLQDVYPTDLA
jgi:hypothetical protein